MKVGNTYTKNPETQERFASPQGDDHIHRHQGHACGHESPFAREKNSQEHNSQSEM